MTRFICLLAIVGITAAGMSTASADHRDALASLPAGATRTAAATVDTSQSVTPKQVVGPEEVDDLHKDGNGLVVVSGTTVTSYSTTGVASSTFTIGWRTVSTIAVDPAGNIYVSRYPYSLVKLAPDGTQIWSHDVPTEITAVFGHTTRTGFKIGAVSSFGKKTYLVTRSGRSDGHRDIVGQNFSDGPRHQLVASTGEYVETYGSDLHRVSYFGAAGEANAPPTGQFAFYQQGAAVELPSGRYLVPDATRGIEYFSHHGVLLGTAPESYLGDLTQDSAMTVIGHTLYYASGQRFSSDQAVSALPVSAVVTAAQSSAPSLGIGVGIHLPEGAYYRPGTALHASLVFNHWWQQLRPLSARYIIRRATGEEIARTKVTHNTTRVTARAIRSGLPLTLPDAGPGPYTINLRLLRHGRTIGHSLIRYGVGAPGDTLNLKTLPGIGDSGGPDGRRGVALADILGTGAHRITLTWSQLLNSQGQLDFSNYNASIAGAAKESARTGIPFSVQLSDGGAALPFIADGTWGSMVQQIVEHWKSEVHYWEPFNEPNDSFSAQDYVSEILEPAYNAVKAAEPSAKVIGGTVVGYEVPYWQDIAAAGGLDYMDIAGIHPYTGFDRSFEEQGFPSYIHQLRSVFRKAGKPDLKIWMTEFAWWSTGDINVTGQADKSARAILWMKALGIPRWEYFLEQGSFEDNGQDYSAIEDDVWVKPTALALMAARTELQHRKTRGFLHTGVAHTYDLAFGPTRKGHGTLQALWTDDGEFTAVVTSAHRSTVHLTDEYGRPSRLALTPHHPRLLRLSGSVQYLHVAAGQRIHLRPVQPMRRDLALASNGATARASSSNPASFPSGAIDGDVTTDENSGFPAGPAWVSGVGDKRPSLTITLPHAERVDRVLLATTGIGSVLTGVRSYDVLVRHPSGRWRTVSRVRGNYYSRMVLSSFTPQKATAVRLLVLRVNYSGYGNGSKPSFWPTDKASLTDPNSVWYGPAIVRELEVYGPERP